MAGPLKTLFGALAASTYLTGVSLVYGEEEVHDASKTLPMVTLVPTGGPFEASPGYSANLAQDTEAQWAVVESVDLYLWAADPSPTATPIDHTDATESLRQLVLSALQDQDGNLGLQPGSNQNVILLMGCCLGNNAGGGVPATLYNFGDPVTAAASLKGGELLELVGYVLKAAPGSIVQAMPLTPTTRGGVGSVTKVGTGALVITPTIAPHGAITITCTTLGALGTAQFTFGVTDPFTGVTTTSAPVTSAAGWSSTGYLVPGTYCTVVFVAGSYTATDVYTISTLGVVAHPAGSGPAVPSFTASPVDYYTPAITITTAGAVGTSQFTYALDGVTASSTITSAASYAIPGTGIVLGFSGTAVAGDTYSFKCAPPTFSNTDLSTNNTALQSTYINRRRSGRRLASSARSRTLPLGRRRLPLARLHALAFNALNLFPRYHVGGPTVGTVLPNAGSVTVDAPIRTRLSSRLARA
jgi:hypothetical protein